MDLRKSLAAIWPGPGSGAGASAGWTRRSKKPIANEPSIYATMAPWGADQEVSYKVLWATLKASPELVAVFTAITEDIVSDGWKLKGGRNNKKKAQKYLRTNHAREVFFSWVFDAIVTGDSYLYKSGISDSKLKSVIQKTKDLQEKYGSLVESKSLNPIIEEIKAIDEDAFNSRSFIDVPSSTVKIRYNPIGGAVEQYVQRVGSREAVFTPEEIIHFRLMRLDGKVYGYSPHRVCTNLADILKDITQYARNYFERGGVPNYMFILENESPNSENFKSFKKAMDLYSGLRYRYKSMALTGKVEVKELNQMNKDFEFRELARWLIQRIAMVWGIPGSRLSDMLSESGQKGTVTSSEGYYRKINFYQSLLEDLINEFLLNEFNVEFVFNKTYKQDELREAQILQIRTDVLLNQFNSGIIKEDYLFDELGIPDEERGDMKPKMTEIPTNRDKQASDLDMQSPSSDKRFDDGKKRETQVQKV